MFILALALATTETAHLTAAMQPADEAAQTCAEVWSGAVSTMAALPKWVDGVTRVDSLTVTCEQRTYFVSKFINEPLSEMREGWEGRKQARWDQLICGGTLGTLVRQGWRISQDLTFASGERVAMDAHCTS